MKLIKSRMTIAVMAQKSVEKLGTQDNHSFSTETHDVLYRILCKSVELYLYTGKFFY